MHAALERYAPSVGQSSIPANDKVAQEWAAGQLFEAAVKAISSNPVTPGSVKQGLYSLKGTTLSGLTPPLTFTRGKFSLHNCYYSYVVENGKLVSPHGMTPTCVPDEVISPIAAKVGL